jgi:antitoxin component of RelBE/YafQ-DinJ toxin-antitoxin module
MDTTNLQIPIRKDLKIAATKAALEQGFSSLQEAVRVFINKMAKRSITVSFIEEGRLSEKAEKRYLKMIKEIKSGKNWHKADSLEDFFKQLGNR